MRIYKFLIIAAVAFFAAGCAHTFEATPTEAPAISLGSWAENLTKANRTQGGNDFVATDDFAVYGYKDKTTTAPENVFDGVVVTAAGETGSLTWSYSPLRFWDTNYDTYTFYAISPAAVGTATTAHNVQAGTFTSASIPFAGNDNDILVADKKVVNKTDGTGNFNNWGKVGLVFNHIATLFDLKIKKATNLQGTGITVRVKSVELQGLANTGTFSVSAAYTDNHPQVTWTPSATGNYTNASGVTPVTIPDSPAYLVVTGTDASGANFLINNLIAMPQSLTSKTIAINYVIEVREGDTLVDSVEHTASIDLAGFDNSDDAANTGTKITTWESGKHYTYFITIDAHAIQFEASVTNWTTVNGFYYLVD